MAVQSNTYKAFSSPNTAALERSLLWVYSPSTHAPKRLMSTPVMPSGTTLRSSLGSSLCSSPCSQPSTILPASCQSGQLYERRERALSADQWSSLPPDHYICLLPVSSIWVLFFYSTIKCSTLRGACIFFLFCMFGDHFYSPPRLALSSLIVCLLSNIQRLQLKGLYDRPCIVINAPLLAPTPTCFLHSFQIGENYNKHGINQHPKVHQQTILQN